jgi:hypothetical protein
MPRRVLRLTPLFALATAWMLGASPAVAAGTLIGAGTFDAGQSAAYASVGWPDVEVGGVLGLNSLADVSPRLRLSYGQASRPGGFGVAIGSGLRLQVAALEGWRIALLAGPELFTYLNAQDHPPAGPGSQSLMGFTIGAPGVVASRTFGDGVTAALGLHAPLTVHLLPEASLAVPMYVSAGFEAMLLDGLTLFAQAELGSVLYGPGGKPDSEFYPRFRLGLALR